jgi:hypothetical protein
MSLAGRLYASPFHLSYRFIAKVRSRRTSNLSPYLDRPTRTASDMRVQMTRLLASKPYPIH